MEIQPPMKTILYNGGILSFNIPENWVEEYSEKDGGTYYENAPDTGTLRLSLISATAPPTGAPSIGLDFHLTFPTKPGEKIKKGNEGDGIKQYVVNSKENGQEVSIYRWDIAHMVLPKKIYLALFSWTILYDQRDIPKFKQEYEMLNIEISKTRFNPDL